MMMISKEIFIFDIEYSRKGYISVKDKEFVRSGVQYKTNFEMFEFFSDEEFCNVENSRVSYEFDNFRRILSSDFKSYCFVKEKFFDINLYVQFQHSITLLRVEDGYISESWLDDRKVDCSNLYLNLFGNVKLGSGELFSIQRSVREVFNLCKQFHSWFVCLSLGGNNFILSSYVKTREVINDIGSEEDIFSYGNYGKDFTEESGKFENLEDIPLRVSSIGRIKSSGRRGYGRFVFIDFFCYNVSKCSRYVATYGELVKEDSLMVGVLIIFNTTGTHPSFYFKTLEDDTKLIDFSNLGEDLVINSSRLSEISKTSITRKLFKYYRHRMYIRRIDPYEFRVRM